MAVLEIISVLLLVVSLFPLLLVVDSFFGDLDFASNKAAVQGVIEIINKQNLGQGKFYDLGSCRGGLAITIARTFAKAKVYGLDKSGFRTIAAKIRSTFLPNIRFSKQDIFKTDVSTADIIYIYLPQELMPDLEKKLQKQAKPKAVIITNRVSFPNWQPTEISGRLFIYKQT